MPSHHFLRARSRGAIGCSRRFNHNATRMCALSVALLFLAFGEMPLPAQDKPMKWGEVPRADLEMKSFPADSNASAVILCDFGEVSFDTEYELNFWRHRRIKILSPAGFKWGEVFLTYRAKDRSQRINDLEGFTFILAADGTVRREKLDKKSIFEEKVDDEHRRIRFALPALVPGAVVEYRYRVHSKYAVYLPNWSFQDSEPTRWSELRVEIPSVFNYVLVHQEISKFDVHESGERPFTTSGSTRLKAMYHRWVMKDLPALREEPFMTTVEDYCAQMRFQLASIRPPGAAADRKSRSCLPACCAPPVWRRIPCSSARATTVASSMSIPSSRSSITFSPMSGSAPKSICSMPPTRFARSTCCRWRHSIKSAGW